MLFICADLGVSFNLSDCLEANHQLSQQHKALQLGSLLLHKVPRCTG